MFRKCVAVAVLFACLVSAAGCAAQSSGEAKLLQEEVKTASSNLKVAAVEMGTLSREYSMSAMPYPAKQIVARLQADEAQYVEHLVTIGQTVKAGDPVAVFRKDPDVVRQTAIKLELEELENERLDGLADRKEQMEELQERIEDLSPDGNGYNTARRDADRQSLLYDMEKMRLEQEQFELGVQERKRKLLKEQQALRDAEADLTVTAPADGIVASLQYMTPGQRCSRGQAVVVLYDVNQLFLVSQTGTTGEFRMGQEVTVHYGRRNERLTTTGRVVAADNLLKEEQKKGYACIVMDEWIDPTQLNTPQVSAQNINAPGVMTLPRSAVQYDNGRAYVELVVGTSSSVRYILTGPNDGQNIVVLAGLEEGAAVINK